MRRVLAAAAVAAAAAVLPLVPGQASADPLCYSVQKIGTTGPTFSTPPICVPYGGSTNCQVLELGLSPTLIVRVLFCVPR